MINRVPAILIILMALASPPLLRPDWKSDLLTYLNAERPDYSGALSYLEKNVSALEGDDLQAARALIPFLAWRTGDSVKGETGIVDYIESYRGNDPDLTFLDQASFSGFLEFWKKWRSSYPLVTDINFLFSGKASLTALPSAVEVGLELENDALYRISLGGVIIEGGYWTSGFHILKIPVADLFDNPGSYDIILDLKSGDIVVRKPIRLAVDVNISEREAGRFQPFQPVFPTIKRKGQTVSPEPVQIVSGLEGVISLYIDDELVMRSRKFSPKSPPIEIPIPGPSMPGQKPYLPPPKTDPLASGVSILDALALAYKAIKDLVKKKPEPPAPPSYQKVTSLSYSFTREAGQGRLSLVRAVLGISAPKASILRE